MLGTEAVVDFSQATGLPLFNLTLFRKLVITFRQWESLLWDVQFVRVRYSADCFVGDGCYCNVAFEYVGQRDWDLETIFLSAMLSFHGPTSY